VALLAAVLALLGGCGDGVVDRVGRIGIDVTVRVVDATTDLPVEAASVWVARSRSALASAELRDTGRRDAEAGWLDISEVKAATSDAQGRARLRWREMMSWEPGPATPPSIERSRRPFHVRVDAAGYAPAAADSGATSWRIVRRAEDEGRETIEYAEIVVRLVPT
jgi:hypothetical protein